MTIKYHYLFSDIKIVFQMSNKDATLHQRLFDMSRNIALTSMGGLRSNEQESSNMKPD